MRAAPRSAFRALTRFEARTMFSALDLFIPPLALLVLVNFCSIVVCVALDVFLDVNTHATLLVGGSSAGVGAAVMLAWLLEGRSFISFKALLTTPMYLIRKMGFYVRLARHGAPTEWRRTHRDGD
jgi:hypothetical protein